MIAVEKGAKEAATFACYPGRFRPKRPFRGR
jgi:hypothetical protein